MDFQCNRINFFHGAITETGFVNTGTGFANTGTGFANFLEQEKKRAADKRRRERDLPPAMGVRDW